MTLTLFILGYIGLCFAFALVMGRRLKTLSGELKANTLEPEQIEDTVMLTKMS